ncbi:metalloreductase STEAP4-like [Rhopilema esculentum]|uniref:metalloreductase STEAP4-like n=1 Tax=Rhopilema esculentum TaxID=499914 RepID=UPI0031CF1963|eukprot:gene17698-9355_t
MEGNVVGIIGYGNFGKALAYCLRKQEIEFYVGVRNIDCTVLEEDVLSEYLDLNEVGVKADIIVLGVPGHCYDSFSRDFICSLDGKIVVDVSNATSISDPCYAEKLADMLPRSAVVKAFNTLSSWSLQYNIYGASRKTFVCGDNKEACCAVSQLARDIGLTPQDVGDLSAAKLLEKKALKSFPEWKFAFILTVISLLVTTAYFYLRYAIYVDFSKLGLYVCMPIANGVTGCMVLLLLAFVYLPGSLVGILQITKSSRYHMLPNWLDRWMRARKQIGLFALLFASVHACLSLILLSGEYYSGMFERHKIKGISQFLYHRFRWNAEVSLLCATLSLTVLTIQGVSSLPTVSQSMSWREWDFIQSKLGFAGLLFGFLHVIFYAGKVMSIRSIRRWKYGIPHQLFLLLIFIIVVMAIKLFLCMPGIRGRIKKVNSGCESGETEKPRLEEETNYLI